MDPISEKPTAAQLTALLLLAVSITLLNCLKPLHLDDPAYYYYAAHIAQHPLAPYDFEVYWDYQTQPANRLLAPPLLPYWWAVAISWLGDHPLLWKLWLLPFHAFSSCCRVGGGAVPAFRSGPGPATGRHDRAVAGPVAGPQPDARRAGPRARLDGAGAVPERLRSAIVAPHPGSGPACRTGDANEIQQLRHPGGVSGLRTDAAPPGPCRGRCRGGLGGVRRLGRFRGLAAWRIALSGRPRSAQRRGARSSAAPGAGAGHHDGRPWAWGVADGVGRC